MHSIQDKILLSVIGLSRAGLFSVHRFLQHLPGDFNLFIPELLSPMNNSLCRVSQVYSSRLNIQLSLIIQ